MSTQPTCEQRIAAQMESRESYLAAIYDVLHGSSPDSIVALNEAAGVEIDPDEYPEEEARQLLDELPLSIDTYTMLRVDLSTGGPADYLEAKLSKEGHGYSVDSVTYHFADWFDHAEMVVPDTSYLWSMVADIVESMES